MKLLTVTIPSYNSEDYMENAVKRLLGSRDDVEIIIVNDGSKDNTLEIANSYAAKYSNVKVIDKENYDFNLLDDNGNIRPVFGPC